MQTGSHHLAVGSEIEVPRAERDPRSGAPSNTRLRYVPGLDGLRALSVTAVLLYHADVGWMSGGFLGVDVFFVISGYLITSLLLAEHRRNGAVALGMFYLHRARRLLPALFLVLATVSLLTVIFLPDEIESLRSDAVAALGYATNWWQIAQHQSYIAAQGRPPLLRHLWSLAIEEQFYLVWPLLLVGMLKLWKGQRRPMLIATGIGIAMSVGTLLVLSLPNDYTTLDPSRVYFGTDTRIFTMLVGAALAMVWSPWRLTPKITIEGRRILDAVGVTALVALLLIFATADFQSNVLFDGGFFGVAVLAALLIAISVHPASRVGTVLLAQQPLRWIGERSYGIYLWHWPIFMVTRPGIDISLTGPANTILRIALTLGAAELSYRFVEEPIRHGGLGRWFTGLRAATGPDRSAMWKRTLTLSAVVTITFALAGVGLASGQSARVEEGLRFLITTTTTTTPLPPVVPPAPTENPSPVPGVTAIGDSVMLGAQNALEQKIPGIRVDAAVSRQFGTAIEILRDLKATGQLSPIVVVHLGSNGVITNGHMAALQQILADRQRVVFLNLKVPRRWEEGDNDVIQRWVPRFENAVLINWNGEGTNHPEFFYGDQFHLNGSGQIYYADLIARTINP